MTLDLGQDVGCQSSVITMSLFAGLNMPEQLFRERFRRELERVNAEPPLKRSWTARQEHSILPTADCDEVKLWIEEVQKKDVRALKVMYMLLCCFNTL